jgi:YidC/Oxa1 family membrane protein insertase
MDNSNNNQNHFRFLTAAVLSMLVLFGWSYFYAPTKAPDNSNTAVANTAGQAATATPSQAPQQQSPASAQPVATVPDSNPARSINIRTPLYEVTLDSKGAVATSWILLKKKSSSGEYAIYADGSTETEKKPLQLISPKALEQRELPFRLSGADPNLTSALNDRNYQISVPEDSIVLAPGEERRVELSMIGEGGLEVRKIFVFRADDYVSDLAVDVKQNGQPVRDVMLAVGASIGDHAINFHSFYHAESEAVASVDGNFSRHWGNYSFEYDAGNRAVLTDRGTIDWVGMGDTYFAMAAIPASPVQVAEYRASKYDINIEPVYDTIWKWVIRSPKTVETRHLVTAWMPVTTDGSVTKVFTGPKDYFLLDELSANLKASDGRAVEIVDLINFSNYRPIRFFVRPLSVPILYALRFFNGLTLNYGVAIIVFTFLFYSLLFPLRWKQSKSFKKASSNAPKMKEIQDRIKELQKKGIPVDHPDMRALQMEQLKLTKDALPIGGCLPMLLQFPLLIAFYTAITISLDARQATFLWLPDLSAADPWHLLEFAFAGSMILAMKFTPTAPAMSPEQQMQQKMMTYLMPVMMLWVMWTAPAGLLLYWLFGNVVSFGQQMLINRMNKTNEPPAAEVVDDVPKNAKKVKGKPKLSTS